MQTSPDYQTLYDRDYALWLDSQVRALKSKNYQAIDLENLIEEIEDMGRSDKRALDSNMIVVLLHLLKYKYQPEKRTNSWKYSIREHRRRIKRILKDSPSLKRYCQSELAENYQDAREGAADETGLPLDIFPVNSPFTLAEILNPDFLPQD